MHKSNDLVFSSRQLAEDYQLNGIIERAIGKIAGELVGECATDFSNGPRTSHDWAYGDLVNGIIKVELKVTANTTFAVELSKDREGLIKSGIAATEADLVFLLSQGRGAIPEGGTRGPDIGKLRAYFPKALLAATYGKEPFLIKKNTNVTENAYVVNIDPRIPTHWHIGDVPMILGSDGQTWMYNLGHFIPAVGADVRLRALFAEIRDRKKESA